MSYFQHVRPNDNNFKERNNMKRFKALFSLLAVILILGISSVAFAEEYNLRGIIVNPSQPYQSTIWTDKTSYYVGDKLNIYFRVDRASYVYVFDIDTKGKVSLIYPNIYSNSNYVSANRTYTLPDNSKYNFSVTGPAGVDNLVIISLPSPISNVDWLKRSLEQNTFAPTINGTTSPDLFLSQLKSVNIVPTYNNNWSSAVTSFAVYTGSSSNPPVVYPPVVVPQYGDISITSSPSGAKVFLNGVEKGTTPLRLSNVTYGTYEVNLIANGYYSYRTSFNINSSSTYNISANLTPINSSGSSPYEVPVFSKSYKIQWPVTSEITEQFSYNGYYGNFVLRTDESFGEISNISGMLSVGYSGLQNFMQISATGVNVPWRGKTFEKTTYPFRVVVEVGDFNNVNDTFFGSTYFEYVNLNVKVYYIGN